MGLQSSVFVSWRGSLLLALPIYRVKSVISHCRVSLCGDPAVEPGNYGVATHRHVTVFLFSFFLFFILSSNSPSQEIIVLFHFLVGKFRVKPFPLILFSWGHYGVSLLQVTVLGVPLSCRL